MRIIRHLTLVRLVWLILFIASISHSHAQALHPWRTGPNGGINVLYCYLLVNGFPCEYSDLEKEQREQSAQQIHTAGSLARLSAKHDADLQPVSLNFKQLASCQLPVIVHVDGDSPDEGAFFLIIAISGNWIDYLDGPSASIHKISCEEFKRAWSGVALLPRNSNWGWCFGVLGIGLGVILAASLKFYKFKFLSEKHV